MQVINPNVIKQEQSMARDFSLDVNIYCFILCPGLVGVINLLYDLGAKHFILLGSKTDVVEALVLAIVIGNVV